MTDGLVGWRCWAATPSGQLVSPIENIIKRNPEHVTALPDNGTVTSWCRREHPSPVSVCCGISATGWPDRMASWLAAWNRRYTTELLILEKLAPGREWIDNLVITEGTGFGPIEEKSLLDYEFFRCTSWRLERIHVPYVLGRACAERLGARYRVPAVVAERSRMDFVRDLLGEPDLSACACCGAEIVGRTDYVGFCDWCTAPPAR